MATATSRKAPPPKATLTKRRKLADELLGLHRKLANDFARMAAIEAELKNMATDASDSFREDFGALGHVNASGAVDKEFKGDVPVIQTEAWQRLKPAERKAHEKSGLVVITPQWGKASSGRITVKVL